MATIKSIRTRGEGGGNNSKEVSISSPVPQKKRRLRRKLSESEEEEESPLEIKRIIKTAEHESTLIQSSDEEQLAETKAIEDKKAIEVEKEEADKEVSNEGEEKEVEKNNGNAIEENFNLDESEQLQLDEQVAHILAEEDSEYEIEKIVSHRTFKGKVVKYEIKWKGYSDSDNTMENANEIHSDVYDLCEKYWDDLGTKRPLNAPGYGKDMHTTTKKTSITQSRPPPSSSKTAPKTNKREPKPNKKYFNNEDMISFLDVPRCMADKGYTFPIAFPDKNTQWNEELKKVSTIQLSPVDSTLVLVYVEWKNGQKTIHSLKEIREKCPGPLIDYYESRLQFV
ncbi:hypothetical protein G6F57_009246 [Rhizopus arrhizus]|uniref:Chromo domain-containing protein n=1 Tax=Rhizopus oryzae TaxID=64495 RepID=A0A9P7BTS3_RHIOR|nr:hypothetical protein G6F30_003942 [Rhizopus arrhizus]KAG1416639.1 hypothetical protein G6F58_005890 [Rhizopus delemar]KAG0990503.1 hypothetical protein G6F29_000194 [Rhizopus arrhizus]KAG0993285.1 hypothetical protein G6F28_006833 [Rhizopus arrhizus]KAG1015424.1 hypothetical protein G6F27_000082 [Rhizopus arrhizus]